MTREEWIAFYREFEKATPSSPVWFAIVNTAITHLILERIEEKKSK
jgi:hypothetical protein